MPDIEIVKTNETIEEKVKSFLDTFDTKIKTERETNATLTDSKISAMRSELKKEMDDVVVAIRKNNVNLPGSNETKEEFSFAKAAFGIINKDFSNAGFEKEIMEETRKKSIDTNTGGQGGFLIPIELASDKIILPAIANSVLKEAGMRVWTGLIADLDIPSANSRPTLVFGSDGAAQTAQNITFALKKLRPKEGGMLVQLSNKLLMQTAGTAEKIVRDLMVEGATIGIDNIGINGTGSDSQPLGILNATGTLTKDISSARMTIDDLAEMINAIEEVDELKQGGGSFITRPIVKSGLKREKIAMFSGDTGGTPFLNPWMSDKVLEDTTGVKIKTTTNIAIGSNLTQGVLGDFKEYVMGFWGGMRLKSSDQAGTAFASNQTWLVMFVDVDALVLRPQAFNIASNIKTDF